MNAFLKKGAGFAGLAIIIGTLAFHSKPKSQLYVSNYENVLGTSLEIKIDAQNEQMAGRAEQAALGEVDRLNKILSGYDESSEFSRWMNADKKPVPVSNELFDVLSLFEQWRVKTGGALDASAETISKLWRESSRLGKTPSSSALSEAVNKVRQQHYILSEKEHTALRVSDAPLILNSFAKTYIMNRASDAALEVKGVTGVVLNMGGDIIVRGKHTEQILVANPKADAENDDPADRITIEGKTIATSGNYRRGVLVDGKWYSHIVDPRTGLPASEVISATVIANNPTDAGALATAMNVLKPEEAKVLAATIPGTEYMIITADGKRIESEGWKTYRRKDTPRSLNESYPVSKDKRWDPNYEVAIGIELATIEGMRVHRPFVGVWVVDEKKVPVRQIAVWYNKPRWLNDLRSWYAAYGDRYMSQEKNISSTSSATRAPGKYTLKWDGKDDAGNYVKEGKYTIYVEAAREHGTHQLMSQEIDSKKPKKYDLAGNVEIASVTIDHRKKTDEN